MRWVSLLLLLGCGDGDPYELRDGWRLELRYWAYEDGTRQWDPTTFFDAAFRLECRLARWSDGHTYCTPVSSPVAYADSTCNAPVGYVRNGTDVPAAFRRDFVMASEQLPSRLYWRGAERTPLAQYWRFEGNNCVGPFEGGDAVYFEVEEVDPVRVRTSAPHGDARLRLSVLSSDDGMQAPASLHDSFLDDECVPTTALDGSTSCSATTTANATYFRDAGCSERALAVRGNDRRPSAAHVEDELGCRSYYRIGREVSKYPLYYRNGADCLPIELPDSELVYALGEQIVAPLDQRTVTTGTRLQVIELVDGAMHVPAETLFDSQLDTSCERVQIGDISLCVPHMAPGPVATYYQTDTCQGLIYALQLPRRSCEPAPRYVVQSTTGKTLRIRELGEPATEPLFELDGSGGCKVVETKPTHDLRMVTTDVPLGTFMAAVRE